MKVRTEHVGGMARTMTIRTEYVFPPIPCRYFDWTAVDDDTYEGGGPIGYGATERDAIDDLMDQLDD